jgi:hypothetical protein
MGIDIGGAEFEGPFQMEVWNPPRKAAVYAIMTKQDDPTDKPASYLPIYIGQSENLDERGFIRSHHKFGCWMREAGSTVNIFIAVYPMPNSTEADRQRIESQLISKYKPVCND